jgi:hypothetical protein
MLMEELNDDGLASFHLVATCPSTGQATTLVFKLAPNTRYRKSEYCCYSHLFVVLLLLDEPFQGFCY